MSAAALSPRVRIMVICEGVKQSQIEDRVFDLKGVRYSVRATSFPFRPSRLWLFLVLSSPRAGRFPGSVQIVDEQTDRVVHMAHINPDPEFHDDDEYCAVSMGLRCSLPRPGRYVMQTRFFQVNSGDVVKGELPFDVFEERM